MAEEKEVDMEQRDPSHLNGHVKVLFEEVLGEPDGARSIDCVWRNSYKCFNCTLSCCYKVMTVLCGIPMAFCWGCEFACLAFYHVWYYTPLVKCYTIQLLACRNLLRLCCETYIGTICESCGMFFNKIMVKSG